MKTLVLVDDRFLAADLAAVLGCREEEGRTGWYEGPDHLLICLEGDPVQPLAFPAGSEQVWPWFPERLRLAVSPEKQTVFDRFRETVQKGGLREVWVGTRPDDTGELRAHGLLLMAGAARLPQKRLWFRERHREGLEEALAMPLPERCARNRLMAAQGRSWLETLWRHHLERALEKPVQRRLPLHLGHLVMLGSVRRKGGDAPGFSCEGIRPRQLWAGLAGVRALWQPGSGVTVPQEVLSRLGQHEGLRGVVIRVQVDQRREQAPMPLNLLDLQQAAWSEWGWTPERTRAQAWTLHARYRAISWPETDGRFWATEQVVTFPERLRAWLDSPWKELCARLLEQERPGLDSPAVRDGLPGEHHGILPGACSAGERAAMEPDARCLLELIFRRFLMGLMPPSREEHRYAGILLGGETFVVRSRRLLEPGWRLVEADQGRGWETPLAERVPEDWVKGRSLEMDACGLEDRPQGGPEHGLLPLLRVLEPRVCSAGGRKGRVACGVGLPGQRQEWLNELIRLDLVAGEQNHVRLTPLGERLLEAVPQNLLRWEEVGRWEEELARLAGGEGRLESFQEGLRQGILRGLGGLEPPLAERRPERSARPARRSEPPARSRRDAGGAFPGLTLGGLLEEALKKDKP